MSTLFGLKIQEVLAVPVHKYICIRMYIHIYM